MKLGYQNVLAEETITVSSEATGFEKENAYDNRTSDYWKPSSVPAWLKATGKMPVGMWMADTTAETLVGSELVDDMSASVWVEEGSNTVTDEAADEISITYVDTSTGGKLYLKDTGALSADLVEGEKYILTYEVKVDTGDSMTPGIWDGNGVVAADAVTSTTYINQTIDFTAGNVAIIYIRIGGDMGSGEKVWFKNIACRLAVPDLSTNNNGLGVYGSIIKSAVATGADLMGYSNLSAVNYLEQPYNADLDIDLTGSDVLYLSGWFMTTSLSQDRTICHRGTSGSLLTSGFMLVLKDDSTVLMQPQEGSSIAPNYSTAFVNLNTWYHLAVVCYGTTVDYYVNGVLDSSNTVVAKDMTNVVAITRFSAKTQGGDSYQNGSLALWDARDYAPTAAEILATYNKEKHYFVAGGTLPTTLISTRATTADYFAMYAHDFAQTGASVVLQYSDDDSVWTDAFDPIFPTTSKPIFKTFTQSSHKYWRVYVDGSVQSAGVLMFGTRLDFANGLTFGFAPPALGQQYKAKNTVSDDGEFLGRSVVAKPMRGNLVFNPTFSKAWVRQYWPDLIRHMEQKPFFVLPEDAYPDEAAFCWAKDIPTPAYASTFMKLNIPILAKVA